MKKIMICGLLACLSVISVVCPAMGQGTVPVLARVEAIDRVDRLGLPVYAHLLDAKGLAYLLVVATETELQQAGWPFGVLELAPDIGSLSIASERMPGALARARERDDILYDDGRRLIVAPTPNQKAELIGLGMAVIRIGTPMVWPSDQAGWGAMPQSRRVLTANPVISNLMAQVNQDTVSNRTAELDGEKQAIIGGEPYTILTRGTSSGTPIRKANQYVYERMQAAGLDVSYQNWTNGSYSGQNIIGVKRGASRSNEVVLVTAHIDSMPNDDSRAPGADDNGSGCVGVMTAADVFRGCPTDRTIRFICFGGEEQGLLGSYAYAQSIYDAGETNVTVYNMDMIAYSTIASRELSLHTRLATSPGYGSDMAVANTFRDVLAAYGLAGRLTATIVSDGDAASDHYSFWQKGYPALFAIESDNNFNPNYHTAQDLMQYINMEYYTDFIKASVGTIAQLAGVSNAPVPTGPRITVNGQAGTVPLKSSDAVSVAVQMMNMDPYFGIPVDWWVVARDGSSWFYLDSAAGWVQSNIWHPALQAALFNLPPTVVLSLPGLATGSYTFYFAVDYPMDGVLHPEGPILSDSVNVSVQ